MLAKAMLVLPALLLLALLPTSLALIEELEIKNDPRHAFHIESFGFEPDGKIQLKISDFMLMVPHDFVPPANNAYNIAFVLQRSASDGGLRLDDTANTCFHENKLNDDDVVISLSSRHKWQELKFTKTITIPGYYHLYFSNCEDDTQAGFNLKLTEFNLDSAGQRVYLSAGQASLPTWFMVLCFFFIVEFFVWCNFLRQQRDNVRSIHWLMTCVLVLKVCTLFFESVKYSTLKREGENDGWTYVYYIFSFLKGMLMFVVIVLIGTGWSYLKPFLTDRDKQLMLAVLMVQMMVNIAMIVLDETAPGSQGWLTWRDVLHLLDMICCCVILLPIVWSIRHLRAAGEADGKAARNAVRLKNFRTFYLLVVSYVYFTRIIVFLLSATLPFELTWLGVVFSEAAALIFYATTGYLFRPQSRNPYLAIGKDDDDARFPEAEMADMT